MLRPVVRRISTLGDNAFPNSLGGGLERFLPISDEMIAVQGRGFYFMGLEQLLQHRLSRNLRLPAEVPPVDPQEVKSIVEQAVRPAGRKLSLQFREVCAVLMAHHDLSLDSAWPRMWKAPAISEKRWSSLDHCWCRPSSGQS